MTQVDLTSGFRCPVCNGNQIDMPESPTDETPVSCANCSAVLGAWGTVRQAQGSLLSKKAEQDVKEVLQAAVPNWQIK